MGGSTRKALQPGLWRGTLVVWRAALGRGPALLPTAFIYTTDRTVTFKRIDFGNDQCLRDHYYLTSKVRALITFSSVTPYGEGYKKVLSFTYSDNCYSFDLTEHPNIKLLKRKEHLKFERFAPFCMSQDASLSEVGTWPRSLWNVPYLSGRIRNPLRE